MPMLIAGILLALAGLVIAMAGAHRGTSTATVYDPTEKLMMAIGSVLVLAAVVLAWTA